jgi:hypothetical protein
MENIQDTLNGWEGAATPSFSNAFPTSVVLEPQGDRKIATPAETQIQYVQVPQMAHQAAPVNPEKPYWFRLAVIFALSGVPSICGLIAFSLWILTSPTRMAGANSELMTGIAMTALNKPGQVTIAPSYNCNQGLFGGQPCSFPDTPTAPTASQPASIQGQDVSIQTNQPTNIWAMPPNELTIEQLDEIKSKTTAETAAQHPQWWQKVQVAYAQKRGN